MTLADLTTLGRSGLLVSPLALGTMTFGNGSWGSADEVSEQVFHAYVEAGGNFVDTADVYSGGKSEELLGKYLSGRGLRDKVVLATKFSFNGGNGRKNVYRALEGSLKRLATDHVDLYWMHVWDRVKPADEMLETFTDLVRAGKIRYFGLSDVPAWYAAEMATLARARGVQGPVALQLPYSLVERSIEYEHVVAARHLGMGLTPWSPLAAGFLSGKYRREDEGATGGGRLNKPNQPFKLFNERNWRTLDVVREVSAEVGRPMAQVALAWVRQQPGVTSSIIGANRVEQLNDSIASLGLEPPVEALKKLTEGSAPEASTFYEIFSDQVNRGIFGGKTVAGWRG